MAMKFKKLDLQRKMEEKEGGQGHENMSVGMCDREFVISIATCWMNIC